MSDLFLARAIHFDESDRNVFHAPAPCIAPRLNAEHA